MSPFDFIKSINETKENLIVDDKSEKEYIPFITNKGLSYFADTVLYANEMNRLNLLDKKPQYCYLLNTVRSRKRYSKWLKNELEDDVKLISDVYGYSYVKAKQVLNLFTPEQLDVMRQKQQKGGIKPKEKGNGN